MNATPCNTHFETLTLQKLDTTARQFCSDFVWYRRVHVHTHAQLCMTLFDPKGGSPPGSSVRGIFQGRILEWGAISLSRGSFPPRDGTHVSCVFCIGRRILYHCTTCEAHFYTISIHGDGIKVERDQSRLL